MLYIPIKIYSNEQSVRSSVVYAAICLGLAIGGFLSIKQADIRISISLALMVGFCICVINAAAAMMRQPMLKVLDDRFSVYTPFGYVMIRFGEVLAFQQGGVPGMRTLHIEINKSAQPRFSSGVARALYAITWLNFTNNVSIKAYMLGPQLGPVIKMLENRRLAAVRLESIDDYEPSAAPVTG